ncbi:MAG: FtsK/SpoIIIE domain-containing protein [Firmicutes bacterium]|nr:FtsK/SpoIIIE domain-containing protein [Bacillota bacterium]
MSKRPSNLELRVKANSIISKLKELGVKNTQLENEKNKQVSQIEQNAKEALGFNPRAKVESVVKGIYSNYVSAHTDIAKTAKKYAHIDYDPNTLKKGFKNRAKFVNVTDSIKKANTIYKTSLQSLASAKNITDEQRAINHFLEGFFIIEELKDNFDKYYSAEAQYDKYLAAVKSDSDKAIKEAENSYGVQRKKLYNLSEDLAGDYKLINEFFEEIFEEESLARAREKFKSGGFSSFTDSLVLGVENVECCDWVVWALTFDIPRVPLIMSLGGTNSNMLINWDGQSASLYKFLENLIFKAGTSFPVRFCNFYISNLKASTSLDGVVGKAIGLLGESNIKDFASPSDFMRGLEHLQADMSARRKGYSAMEASGRRITSIKDYNEAAPDNKQPATFLICYDYPNGYTKEHQEYIERLAQNGNSTGIFVVLVNNAKKSGGQSFSQAEDISARFAGSLTLSIKNNEITTNTKGKVSLNLMDGFNIADIKQTIVDESKKIRPIELADVALKTSDGVSFSDVLEIPIGKKGADVAYIELSTTGDARPHTILAGKTGSGKTIFLHNLILSGALKYAPNELEYYLIDLKDDVEFSEYKDKLKIPHFRLLASGQDSSVQSTLGMLKAIESIVQKRNALFREFSVPGISAFNKAVKEGRYDKKKYPKLMQLPRALVIIDEYQTIFQKNDRSAEKCIAVLVSLAQKARSAGVGLVLASQRPPSSNFQEINPQLGNRIALLCDQDTLDKLMDNDRRANLAELERQKGNAYYKRGASLDLIRISTPADSSGVIKKDYIDKIRAKFPPSKFPDKLIISGDKSDIDIQNANLGFASGAAAYREDEMLAVAVGQSVSSGGEIEHLFDRDNPNMLLIGDRDRAKNIESVMLLDLLFKKSTAQNIGDITYVDFKKNNEAYVGISAIAKSIDFTQGALEATNKLKGLLEISKQRVESGASKPMFVFIGSGEMYTQGGESDSASVSGGDALAMLKAMQNSSGAKAGSENIIQQLLKNAKAAKMHIVLHADSTEPFTRRGDNRLVARAEEVVYNTVFTRGSEFLSATKDSSIQNSNLLSLEKTIKQDDPIVYLRAGELEDTVRRINFKSDANTKKWLETFLKDNKL